jgi:signal transduction histidine kinase
VEPGARVREDMSMPSWIERLRLPAHLGGYARLRVGLIWLGVLIVLAFATSTAWDAWRLYRHSIVSTDRELENLAAAMAEQTAWSWQAADLLMVNIARAYRGHKGPPQSIDQFLATATARVPLVHATRIIDARGILQNSSDDRGQGADVSDRSYFIAQRDQTAHGLFVSEPLLSRSEGRTAVMLSRPLEDEDGRFAGIVSANVDLSELGSLYAAVNLRGTMAVQLLREDGTLLIRRPETPSALGRRFPALVAISPGVALQTRNPIDGERDFVAVARVRSLPLLVAVSRNEAAALTTSYQETVHGAVRTLLLAVLAASAVAALVRQLQRLEQADRALRQAQKMEALGTLAGGIAHDFNNILGSIVGYGELAQQQAPAGSSLRRYLDNVMHAAGRARALVDRILGFSRTGLAERVPVDIQAVVTETLELLQSSLAYNIRLERSLSAEGATVIGDETQLHQVTMNLCTNALQAMPEGGVLRVALESVRLAASLALSRGQLAAGDYVRLAVSDTGAGIRAELLDRIFDPFFTTKRVGEGTGLGLSLVHGIIADLGGTIDVSSIAGKGATFSIWLPKSRETAQPVAGGHAVDLPRGKGETVMIVDDERSLMSLGEETLTELGYQPVGFGSSTEALRAFQTEPNRFNAVVTDEVMPDLLGTQLAAELTRLRPGLPVILMSGHGGPQLAERAGAAGVSEVLRKPLQKRDLAESLAKVLA